VSSTRSGMSKLENTSWTSSFSSSASIRRRIFFAVLSSSTSTVVFGTIVSSALSTVKPAPSTASRTLDSESGAAVIWNVEPSSSTSSAPPSAAASISSSSSTPSESTSTIPRRSNCQATAPDAPRLPSCFENAERTSEAVRLRLSVSASTRRARDSFGKRTPRFLSAAPFLCLMELHLLCPDMPLLFYQVEEPGVHTGVVGQLRMERRDEHASLSRQHWMAVVLGEDLDVRPRLLDPRRADEDASQC